MAGYLRPALYGLAIALLALPASCIPLGTIDTFPPKPMMREPKAYKLDASEIRELVTGAGTCFASDMITVDGNPVGYMYREAPEHDFDSGWRFFSGLETGTYTKRASNFELYNVNTIANYDPEIIPLLDAPVGSAFRRQGPSGPFLALNQEPGQAPR